MLSIHVISHTPSSSSLHKRDLMTVIINIICHKPMLNKVADIYFPVSKLRPLKSHVHARLFVPLPQYLWQDAMESDRNGCFCIQPS